MSAVTNCFFEKATSTCTYVVHDPDTKAAAIIDPVMDFEPAAATTTTTHDELVMNFVRENGLKVEWILETHVHADHLTGAKWLKEQTGAKTGIGANVTVVQEVFKGLYNLGDDFPVDGSQFDHLFADGETFKLGNIDARVIATPGHTPACICFLIGDSLFSGDTLFMPDFGSARCDFPGGSAEALFDSVQKMYALPDETKMFVGHDYQPGGRDLKYETTIGEQKATNKHVKAETTREEFVNWRTERDATLGAPRLLLQSLQVNLRNGALPEPEDNGTSFLKIPMNVVGKK